MNKLSKSETVHLLFILKVFLDVIHSLLKFGCAHVRRIKNLKYYKQCKLPVSATIYTDIYFLIFNYKFEYIIFLWHLDVIKINSLKKIQATGHSFSPSYNVIFWLRGSFTNRTFFNITLVITVELLFFVGIHFSRISRFF